MSIEDPDELQRIDEEIRVNELKERVRELSGEPVLEHESHDCPPEIRRQFWESVMAWESAPAVTHLEQLQRAGVCLPEPGSLRDRELVDRLRAMIHGLAELDVYLSHTDHLSDRELYDRLWSDVLREPTKDIDGWTCFVDLLGSGSEEDIRLYYQYYADHSERQAYRGGRLPARQSPPFDRDRSLPKPPGVI